MSIIEKIRKQGVLGIVIVMAIIAGIILLITGAIGKMFTPYE